MTADPLLALNALTAELATGAGWVKAASPQIDLALLPNKQERTSRIRKVPFGLARKESRPRT